MPVVPLLAAEREPSERLIDELQQLAAEEFSGVGPALLALGSELASKLELTEAAARLAVAAAERKPDDTELVRGAERLAHQLGDQELLDQVLAAVPARERLAGLLELAERCRKD